MAGRADAEDKLPPRWRINLLQLRAGNHVCFGVGVGAMLIKGFSQRIDGFLSCALGGVQPC